MFLLKNISKNGKTNSYLYLQKSEYTCLYSKTFLNGKREKDKYIIMKGEKKTKWLLAG